MHKPSVAMSAPSMTRREMLRTSALGFGGLALSYLMHVDGTRAAAAERTGYDLQPRPSHFAGQARAVIMLMQNGGPSQMDLFDPKPEPTKRVGQVYVERV